MRKQKQEDVSKKKPESVIDLKNETVKDDGLKKGYNEKNPTQPQGAFKPDAVDKKN